MVEVTLEDEQQSEAIILPSSSTSSPRLPEGHPLPGLERVVLSEPRRLYREKAAGPEATKEGADHTNHSSWNGG